MASEVIELIRGRYVGQSEGGMREALAWEMLQSLVCHDPERHVAMKPAIHGKMIDDAFDLAERFIARLPPP
jgi:hypothetical protein